MSGTLLCVTLGSKWPQNATERGGVGMGSHHLCSEAPTTRFATWVMKESIES